CARLSKANGRFDYW
nr:immunoglobulin heavy chain junction region [Macaca mulatta]